MEKRIHEAAVEGSVTKLHQILKEDRCALDKIMVGCFIHTPLHVAAFLGHVDFVRETLHLKADLAQVLDLRRWSPLHLASAQGHVNIVKELLLVDPYMCTVLDGEGKNPLHLAAMKGKTEVLRELVGASPHAARRRVDQEETILHLCVKHNQLGTLKLLLERNRKPQFVNAKDGDGNTILHLAVADERFEIVKYLFTSGTVDVNIHNANGNTALEILPESQRNLVQEWDVGNSIQDTATNLTEAADIPSSGNGSNGSARPIVMPSVVQDQSVPLMSARGSNISHQNSTVVAYEQATTLTAERRSILRRPSFFERQNTALSVEGYTLGKIRDALLVVASLSASVAFQAGVSPSGGVWQDNSAEHSAGEAVIAYNYPDSFKYYLRSNTIGFLASLSTIMMLTSGLPFKRKIFMWILIAMMLLSVTSMAFTYSWSIVWLTPKKDKGSVRGIMYVAVPVWCGVMILLHLVDVLRLFQPVRRSSNSVVANHDNGNHQVQ